MKFFTLYFKEISQTFFFFFSSSISPHWPYECMECSTNRLDNRSHCTSLPFMHFIWHLLCISNAEPSLQLQRRGKFVFCNTELWCLPTNKLALTVTSNGEGGKEGGGGWKKEKRAKPKCFLIGPLGDRGKKKKKSAASVEQVCSKMWDFYNGYICFCKTYTVKRHLHSLKMGEYANRFTKSRVLWS